MQRAQPTMPCRKHGNTYSIADGLGFVETRLDYPTYGGESLQLPVWYAEWEYECCGADVRVGDRIEWRVFFHCPQAPSPSDDGPRFTVASGTDIEAVWRWIPFRPNADGLDMIVEWGELRTRVCLPPIRNTDGGFVPMLVDQGLKGRFVRERGKLWREDHVDPDSVPTSVGTVQAVYWHRGVWHTSADNQGRTHAHFVRYEPGIAIHSTDEKGHDSGDFRFVVEMAVRL